MHAEDQGRAAKARQHFHQWQAARTGSGLNRDVVPSTYDDGGRPRADDGRASVKRVIVTTSVAGDGTAERGDVQVEVLSDRELFAIIRGGQPHDFNRRNFRVAVLKCCPRRCPAM